MALQLWLLRHGEAVPHDAASDDAARELTDRGRDQSRAAGRALAALEVEVHLCFTSPKVRARQTAELACAELGVEPIVHEPLASEFDGEDALDVLSAAEGDQRVLIVGHDPDFTQVVYDLTGARIDLKKGGVAGVRMDGSRGELIVLLRPRELDRIGC
jgi:phosphohistidine phosphatase